MFSLHFSAMVAGLSVLSGSMLLKPEFKAELSVLIIVLRIGFGT